MKSTHAYSMTAARLPSPRLLSPRLRLQCVGLLAASLSAVGLSACGHAHAPVTQVTQAPASAPVAPVAAVAAPVVEMPPAPVVPLWPNGAPGSEARKGEAEVVKKNKAGIEYNVANIHNPSLTVYLPPKEKATGLAMIVMPGGGHSSLAIDHEGHSFAKWLASHGIAGLILKYRLQREKGSTYKIKVEAVQDGRRALRVARSMATQWNINPKKVGIIGFSAGGELAAYVASLPDDTQPPLDAIDNESAHPDFQILIYPGPVGIANDAIVTKDIPPTFLAAGDKDGAAVVLTNHYLALRAAGVSTELHILADVGHGFGLTAHPATVAVAKWPTVMTDWLAERGFLKK